MKTCPFCGKTESSIMVGSVADTLPAKWREHIGSCAEVYKDLPVLVTILFDVRPPVSLETNHVEYVNEALGLRYRFYYPVYLDRQHCGAAIAESVPVEIAARVKQSQIAAMSYESYQRLNDAYTAVMGAKLRVKLRKWWGKVWFGGLPPAKGPQA